MKRTFKLITMAAAALCLLSAAALAERNHEKPAEKTVVPAAEISWVNDRLVWVYSQPAGLWFTKTEVTLGQFERCVSAGGCRTENRSNKGVSKFCNLGYRGRSDHPMNCVDWYGARDFCRWVGGRLPDREEWQKEASNGGKREYPWGDGKADCSLAAMTLMNESGMELGCGRKGSWPVCSMPSGNSASGLCDMSGSVWEWTSSGSDSSRVLCGGSWNYFRQAYFKASGWHVDSPSSRSDAGYGFRCVRDPRESDG